MPRPANSKSKTTRVTLIAKPNQEVRVRAFKEICARNGISMSDILMEKVDAFLRAHNWPPGNSQTLMQVFLEPSKETLRKCKKLRRQKQRWAKYIGWCSRDKRWVTEETCRLCDVHSKSTG